MNTYTHSERALYHMPHTQLDLEYQETQMFSKFVVRYNALYLWRIGKQSCLARTVMAL